MNIAWLGPSAEEYNEYERNLRGGYPSRWQLWLYIQWLRLTTWKWP